MDIAKVLYKSFYWKIFQFFTSFIINILFVRIFQSATSAEFYSLLYLLSLVISFFTFGMDIGLNYYLSKKQLSPRTANLIILFVVVIALAVSIPLIYFFYQPSCFPGISRQQILLFSAYNIAGGLLTTMAGAIFTANGQNYIPSVISSILNGLMIALSIFFIHSFTGHKLIQNLFLLYFILSFLQGLLLFVYSCWLYPGSMVKRGTKVSGDISRQNSEKTISLRNVLHFSFAAFITNFIFYGGSRLYLYFLPYRTSQSDMGNYIQAYKIVEYVGLVTAFIYYPFMALVAGENKKKMDDIVLFLVRLSNTFILIFSILILTCGQWFFPFLFGKSFDLAYGIFLCFIPGLFASSSSIFFTAYYFGRGSMKYNFVSAVVLLLSMCCFYFPFLKLWGLYGAAFAFSGATLLSFCYDIYIFRKYCHFRLQDVLFMKKADINYIGLFVKKQLS